MVSSLKNDGNIAILTTSATTAMQQRQRACTRVYSADKESARLEFLCMN